ncbi:LuxR C-terminal-related transcriptional regulator [Erwinia tracheiphila]|nr:LuxR C-terminal-related transcriptional regulator [Erwinia tracheiphila]UIA83611.1 LuxR C-terminal-related transcriptional regulator [Erwinia tracheiphila]UIA87955.1 LuxR C-terminal-related transcriptional regulator [Erwinia tracheiphila]UIA92196.1 LuxR C-terminal-related transcriptional regulator [Erwinia tracheiphila]UIA96543.1 LuxR C-terminal-related transcriptional regulator [Erwinia tracheiphila]
MNILIISEDNYFITGVISLINQSWFSPHLANHPVYLIDDKKRLPFQPDVIISDIFHIKNVGRHVAKSCERINRHVLLNLATLCQAEPGRLCLEHALRFEKYEAAKKLQQLFRNGSSPVYLPMPLEKEGCKKNADITLSKQQAMVVQYTREGLSLTDISRRTSLSVKTISTHKRAIMRKLGMKNNSEFYQYTLKGVIQR